MSFTSGRRDLHVVAAAKAVSFLGDELAMIALLLRLQPQGPSAVAALLIANFAPLALLSGVAGRLVDRYDNRRLLVASSLAQLALCLGLAFADGSWVLLLVALLGAGQAVNGAAWQALVPALVPASQLAAATARVQAATTVAAVVAPALAGLLVGAAGSRAPLLVDAVTFAAVTVAAVVLRVRRRPVRSGVPLMGGMAIVRRHPVLRAAIGLLGLFVLLGAMVNVVEVFLVRETLHASPTWFGLVSAAHAVGLLLGVTCAGRLGRPLDHARALAGAAAVLACGIVLIGLSPSVHWMLAACLVTGTANGVLNVASSALIMGAAAPAERGRVGAVLTGVVSATQLAALAVGGLLAGVLAPRTIFLLGGTLGLLVPALLGRGLVREVRRSVAGRVIVPEWNPGTTRHPPSSLASVHGRRTSPASSR